ncbi:MAG: hypothetical protein ACOYBJ_00130 [Patescibacteria group bacterium]|jgi:hypothetical protein
MSGVYSDKAPTAQTLVELPIHDRDVWAAYRQALNHFGGSAALLAYGELLPTRHTDLDVNGTGIDDPPSDFLASDEAILWLERQIDAFDVAYQRDDAHWYEFWLIGRTAKGGEELGRVRLYRPLRE